jgi:hypothetical protein
LRTLKAFLKHSEKNPLNLQFVTKQFSIIEFTIFIAFNLVLIQKSVLVIKNDFAAFRKKIRIFTGFELEDNQKMEKIGRK